MTLPTCRITDDWLPLPAGILTQLGWTEGTCVSIEVVAGVGLVVTVADPVADDEPHPADCLCDRCTCAGCGNRKHPGRCPKRRKP